MKLQYIQLTGMTRVGDSTTARLTAENGWTDMRVEANGASAVRNDGVRFWIPSSVCGASPVDETPAAGQAQPVRKAG